MVTNSDKYKDLLNEILPSIELQNDDFDAVYEILSELKDYYLKDSISIDDTTNEEIAIITTFPEDDDWVTDIKTQVLFAGTLILDDPLLFKLITFERTYCDNNTWFDDKILKDHFVQEILRTVEKLYSIKPFIDQNLVCFIPMHDLAPECNFGLDMIQNGNLEKILPDSWIEHYEYLKKHTKILDYKSNLMPSPVEFKLPIIDRVIHDHIDRPLAHIIGDLGLNPFDWLVLKWLKFYMTQYERVQLSLALSERIDGTMWTPLREHWNLANYITKKFDKKAVIYEFLKTMVQPDISICSSDMLCSIRKNEEAFANFRKQLRIAGTLINSVPNDENFHIEAKRIFHDTFEPQLNQIANHTKKINVLKELPKVCAALGFAFSSVLISGGPLEASILSTIATGLGFSNFFKKLFDQNNLIKSDASYVLWEIKKDASKKLKKAF